MPSTNLTALSPKTKSFTKQKKVNIFPVKYEHYNPPNQYDLKPLTSRISVSIDKIFLFKNFLGKFQTKRVKRILERAYIYFSWSRRVYSIKR